MSKKIKAMEIEALRKAFGGVKDYVIIEPIKVDSATEYEFRKKLREKKVRALLVKNTYAKKIFTEMGIEVNVWSGPTLLCWGGANIKELSNNVEGLIKDLKKDPKSPDKFKVKIAVAHGLAVSMDVAKTMPTREEAVGNVLGALLEAGSSLVSALVGPGAQLAGILKAIEEKKPEEPTAAPAEEVAPAVAG